VSLSALFLAMMVAGARGQTKEYRIKAAFLLNFAQFVDWPDSAFATPSSPFEVGVLGADPFGPALDETVQGENVHSRKLAIRRSKRIEDLADCQMIFVSKSERARLAAILAKTGSRPVVTVGEIPGFAAEGGTINFYLDQNKVRFEINAASAKLGGLKISSQLLGLGKIVGPPGGSK
jgi:hypothetical protein